MPGSQRIRVQFDQYGNVRMETEGFVGKSCEEASAYVENALRGNKTRDDATPEMYAPADGVKNEDHLRF